MEKILIGLSGVVLGAILTHLKELHSKYNDARYLAVRVTCVLDSFVAECVDAVCDNGSPDQHGCLVTTSKKPSFNIDHIDGKWQSLPFELMSEILDFPNRLINAEAWIQSEAEYGDGPPYYADLFKARKHQYSVLGMEALSLAAHLRAKYSMPRKIYDKYKPEEHFMEYIDDMENT